MADPITDAVTAALAPAEDKGHPEAPPAPTMPPHVAANIMEMLKRVQTTGLEAYAFVEAFGYLQRFTNGAAPPTGPGVPFNPGR